MGHLFIIPLGNINNNGIKYSEVNFHQVFHEETHSYLKYQLVLTAGCDFVAINPGTTRNMPRGICEKISPFAGGPCWPPRPPEDGLRPRTCSKGSWEGDDVPVDDKDPGLEESPLPFSAAKALSTLAADDFRRLKKINRFLFTFQFLQSSKIILDSRPSHDHGGHQTRTSARTEAIG